MIHRRAIQAVRAGVLIDVVRLRLQDAHTAAVEPVLASVAANVKPVKEAAEVTNAPDNTPT